MFIKRAYKIDAVYSLPKLIERVGRKMDWAYGSHILRHLGRLFLQKNDSTYPVFFKVMFILIRSEFHKAVYS